MRFFRSARSAFRLWWLVQVAGVATVGVLAQQPPLATPTPVPVNSPASSPAPANPADATASLDAWLNSPTLWQTRTDAFPQGRTFRLRWVSAAHDTARSAFAGLRLGDLPVAELITRFASVSPGAAAPPTMAGAASVAPPPPTSTPGEQAPVLASVQVSVYNRGDAGNLDQKNFEDLVARSKETLNHLTHASPVERGTDNGSAVPTRGLVWTTPQSRFLLEWSATPENRVQNVPYRAEFVRLKVTPERDQPKSVLEQMRAASRPVAGSAQPTTVKAAELPARIVKTPDGGTVLPNIPMVNQGDKGYCVTATTERVLRYYGVEVDQNELAQLAGSSAEEGTSVEEMVDSLRKLASRFKVNVVTEIKPTSADFTQEINDYNRVVRAAPKDAGLEPIDLRQGLSFQGVYGRMNGPALRDARTKINPAYMTRFEHEIQAHLARGIPMFWTVILGLLPEEKLHLRGRDAHMRLIIGYNEKTKEVYYSDTWGLGHEMKKMPLADAWTITTGLLTLEPI